MANTRYGGTMSTAILSFRLEAAAAASSDKRLTAEASKMRGEMTDHDSKCGTSPGVHRGVTEGLRHIIGRPIRKAAENRRRSDETKYERHHSS